MTARSGRLIARTLAIAIAVAGLMDPAWSGSRSSSLPIIVVRASAIDTREAEAHLREVIGSSAMEIRQLTGSRLPCAPDEQCVLIADGSIDVAMPTDVKPFLIPIRPDSTPNVAIASVAIGGAHSAAASEARVEVVASGIDHRDVVVRARDGVVTVGSTRASVSSGTAAIDVPWLPLASGARHLRFEIDRLDGETATSDNAIDVGVEVSDTRFRILVFDPRPSWSSTFVRRALEDDGRFEVAHRARVAPSISVGTPTGRLDVATLDQTDVVIAGAPDALTREDVDLLDRFVRERGGTVMLLAERALGSAPANVFFPGGRELLSATPVSLGPLTASEMLMPPRIEPTDTVLARTAESPVVVNRPRGFGRVIMSGAMDAWRYRDAGAAAFGRFWQSAAADAAAASGPLTIRVADSLAAAGSRVPFTITVRSLTPQTALDANAVVRCGDALAHAVRLWPAGAGEFQGDVRIANAESCTIEATVGDDHAVASVISVDKPNRGAARTLARLMSELPTELPPRPVAMEASSLTFPMRSPWWSVPFAGCLAVEWWLRRRAGLA